MDISFPGGGGGGWGSVGLVTQRLLSEIIVRAVFSSVESN